MNSQASPILLILFSICLVLVQIPLSSGNADAYTSCSSRFNCGGIKGLGFPFWGGNRTRDCGYPGLELTCKGDVATMDILGVKYRALNVYPDTQVLQIAREDYMGGFCPSKFVDTSLDSTLLDYVPDYINVSIFYGCPTTPFSMTLFNVSSCSDSGFPYPGDVYASFLPQSPGICGTSVTVPVLQSLEGVWNWAAGLGQALQNGFEVKWKVDGQACSTCIGSGGICGYDFNSNRVTCLCPNQTSGSVRCPSTTTAIAPEGSLTAPAGSSNLNLPLKISVGVAAGGGSIIVLFIMICCIRRECLPYKAMVFWKKRTKNDLNVDAFIRNYGSFAPTQYSYSKVKKMTNSFKDKLGQGGYGSVYKGKLTDGRLVAVKILSESKGNGEEFINEVASISRTSHVNIVTLLGFCYERTERALIYEFMPNGSLDKFIYDRGSSNSNCQLEWKILYQIAVGIARGLEYLHRGCTTRILHFDIKPQNILLDEDFCPKISDFGLAKLCQMKESIVSMLGARGTAGYIAPEVFCRSFGGVSHKSDVYSYGMMVLEMVGGRKNIKVEVVRTSEIYFPHWIYDHMEPGDHLELHGVLDNEEEEIARKMILVSLWCIQTNPSNRPSIRKVVEMLEGSLQSVEIPPKPFLFSPTRSPQDSSTAPLS